MFSPGFNDNTQKYTIQKILNSMRHEANSYIIIHESTRIKTMH